MENFNKVFKKVFAVLTIFALFFTLNVKADENAGQVDNQVDPIEEREVDLVSTSSVPPETVSGTLDEVPPVPPVEGQGEVVETTPAQTEAEGEGDGNADVPPTPTEGGSEGVPQTVPGTLTEGEGSEQTPTLPASEGEGSEQTPTLPASEGDGNESPSAPVETPASEQVPAATGTLSETPTDTVTMMAAPAAAPEAQLLGAGDGTRASEPQTVFYTNISNGKTITAKDLLAKVDIIVNDEDISNVTLGETTTYLTVTNTSGIYSIKNNGSYEGTLPILITVGETTYTINVDSGPDRSKELVDYEDGTYRLELTVTGESITTPPPINVLIIYDESSSMLKYWTDEEYGSVGHKGDDLLNDNRYYSDENPNIDSAYIGSTAYVPNNGEGYFPLYKQNADGTYSKITDDEHYTGTLYMRTGTNSYAVYGDDDNEKYELDGVIKIKRFATRRADSSEFTINTFVQDLYTANPNTNISLVGFASYAGTSTEVNWTTNSANVTNILSSTGDRNTYNTDLGYVSGTNYEAALRQGITELNKLTNNNKTFVIFITDGEPSQSMDDPTATPTSAYSRDYYIDTREETTTIRNRLNTTFFGIYAYGRENDYLDDLVYDAHYATPRTTITSSGDTTGINNWYFKAKNTSELEKAMANIFGQIILGIGSTSITDGTTSHVVISETASSHLLDVDTNSFKYYKNDVEWAEAPEATLNADGQVIWDLGNNIILDNGVTYKVTFDVWPSQETLDLIADLKNGTQVYATLPEAIKQYLYCTGTGQDTVCTLRTNTTATLSYVDTRPNGTNNGSSLYVNPDPVPTAAVKLMTINKTWNGGGAENEVDLYVTRDENNKWYKVPITVGTTTSSGQASIAIGILTDHNNFVYLRTTGHDYTFYEDGENAYHWELNVPTYRPMLINNRPKMLEKVTSDKIEATGYIFYVIKKTETVTNEDGTTTQVVTERTIAVKGNQTYTPAENEVILSTSYYNMTDINEFKLSGVNERRSNLDIIKEVTGTAADKELEFRFDIKVDSADSTNPIDKNIWFSVADTTTGIWDPIEVTTDATPEILPAPSDATYNATDNTISIVVDGKTLTYKCVEGNSLATCKYKTNYYYVPDNTSFYVMMKNGYSLRIRNILTGSTYTITETAPANFTTNIETYIMKDDTKVDWPKDSSDDSVSVSGRTVTGTIKETSVNYTVKYNNIHETKDITLTKTWDDATNQDGIRPTTIYVKVVNNYNETVSIIAINATNATVSEDGNTWTYTITGLDKYRNGNEITYTIVEVSDIDGTPIAAYDENSNAVITLDKDTDGNYKYTINGNDITNTHIPAVVDAIVTKVWDDTDETMRPDELVVTLLIDGEESDQTVTLNADNEWTGSITGLPKFAAGVAITYSFVENVDDLTDGYVLTSTDVTTEKDGDLVTAYVTTLTNTYKEKELDLTKTWDDDNNRDGIRPDSIRIDILVGEVVYDTITLSLETEGLVVDGNVWSYTVTGLPFYMKGEEVNYTIAENLEEQEVITLDNDGAGHYKYTINGNDITNTHIPETIKIIVSKVWEDNNNQDGIRPGSVKVTLTSQTESEEEVTTEDTQKLDASNEWKYEWLDLYKYRNGELIAYDVEEVTTDVVTGEDGKGTYAIEVSKTGELGEDLEFVVTNTHTPILREIEIIKVWTDFDNQYETRPIQIVVRLYADGTEIKELILDEESGWSATVSELPVYENGKEIKYTITEDEIELYEAVITGDMDEGFKIENFYSPKGGDNPPPPQTGDNVWIYIATFILSLLGMGYSFYLKKKYN